MGYTKPEINRLGDAGNLIQNGLKFWSGAFDPAYGLFVLQPGLRSGRVDFSRSFCRSWQEFGLTVTSLGSSRSENQKLNEGETTVKYAKPEINVLGDAVNLIENGTKFWPGSFEANTGRLCEQPAYDLDE